MGQKGTRIARLGSGMFHLVSRVLLAGVLGDCRNEFTVSQNFLLDNLGILFASIGPASSHGLEHL